VRRPALGASIFNVIAIAVTKSQGTICVFEKGEMNSQIEPFWRARMSREFADAGRGGSTAGQPATSPAATLA
jgi:hypothetical protein